MVALRRLLGCRLKWFAQIKYINGGDEYSTNDIEHGMLRANAPSPSSIAVLLGRPGWAPGSLKSDDLRLAYVSPLTSLSLTKGQIALIG